jgi:hypothetical protein
MQSITDTISDLQDQVIDIVKNVQEPTVDAVEKVVERIEGILPEDRPSLPYTDSLPNPVELVDTVYGYIEQLVEGQQKFVKALVANQHEFAKAVAQKVTPLFPAATKPAPVAKATKATKAA